MDSYIIQIQPRDELTAVIDKIINTQADKIYILVSESSRIAQSAINFRLLKREADALGKEIIIVSSSPLVQNLALKSSLQVHLETFTFRQETTPGDFMAPALPPKISDVFAPAGASDAKSASKERSSPKARPAAPEKSKASLPSKPDALDRAFAKFWTLPTLRPKVPRFRVSRPRISFTFLSNLAHLPLRRALFLLSGIAALLAALTFYSVLPRATVRITPFSESVELRMQLSADTAIAQAKPEKFTVPAQIFEKAVESSKTIPATGEKEVREKTQGTIKVYNGYSSAPQTLVKNTRFVAEDGKIFRTVETIVVPGAQVENGKVIPSFTTAKVAASEPGAEYNIGPSSFSIPGFKGSDKYLGFYGKSEQALTGGKIGKVKTITENDYNSARKALEEELSELSEKELTMLIPPDLTIPEGAKTSEDLKISGSNAIGDIADSFVLKGTVTIHAFAVSQGEIIEMLLNDFYDRFPDKRIVDSDETPRYSISKLDFDKGKMFFTVSFARKSYARIDSAEMLKNMKGKTEEEVRAYLGSLKTIREATITFWPFWVSAMPSDGQKIKVILEGLTF